MNPEGNKYRRAWSRLLTGAAFMLGIVLARKFLLASKSYSHPYDLPSSVGDRSVPGSQLLAEVLCPGPCPCSLGTCCAHLEFP